MGPPLWGKQDGDIYWSLVKLLLHFDGNYLDSSSTATHASGFNGATISGTEQKYGSGALDATSSISDYAYAAGSALALGTDDFCIECWFNDKNLIGGNAYFWALQCVGTGQTMQLWKGSYYDNHFRVDAYASSSAYSTYSYNTYHHSAVTRSGNDWTHWVDGVAESTWTYSGFNGGTASNIYIGNGTGGSGGALMLIDDFRLTVGVPRYTAPFTPAGPFPDGPA